MPVVPLRAGPMMIPNEGLAEELGYAGTLGRHNTGEPTAPAAEQVPSLLQRLQEAEARLAKPLPPTGMGSSMEARASQGSETNNPNMPLLSGTQRSSLESPHSDIHADRCSTSSLAKLPRRMNSEFVLDQRSDEGLDGELSCADALVRHKTGAPEERVPNLLQRLEEAEARLAKPLAPTAIGPSIEDQASQGSTINKQNLALPDGTTASGSESVHSDMRADLCSTASSARHRGCADSEPALDQRSDESLDGELSCAGALGRHNFGAPTAPAAEQVPGLLQRLLEAEARLAKP